MKTVVIFAQYPDLNPQDGMRQRILAIDEELAGCKRIYVQVGKKSFLEPSHRTVGANIEVYCYNMFRHWKRIQELIDISDYIYIHSVYNFENIIFFSFRNKNITVDLHGTVPEELSFAGHNVWSLWMQFVERRLFATATNFVCVSEEMVNYYHEKYVISKDQHFLLKPIAANNVFLDANDEDCTQMRDKLGIKSEDVVFIYSGNTQKWQNVDLAIDTIEKINKPNYYFLFLTGEKAYLQRLLKDKFESKGIRYHVDCVRPEELYKYYKISHYGFILRDEHILNRVAAPTKLVEYLYYGLTPIVKYERIGDTLSLGYEYLKYNEINYTLQPKKSIKNKDISMILISRGKDSKIDKFLGI